MTTIPLNVSLSVLASLQKRRAHVLRNMGEGWGWQKFTLASKMVKGCSVFGCTKRFKGALSFFFPYQESKEKRVDGLS